MLQKCSGEYALDVTKMQWGSDWRTRSWRSMGGGNEEGERGGEEVERLLVYLQECELRVWGNIRQMQL